jgi:hypothetical protein
MRREVLMTAGLIAFGIAGALAVRSFHARAGLPLTHKWRQTRVCQQYAKRNREIFVSGLSEPIETETFFSERLGTCVQAQTFAPNDYAVVDLTKTYSNDPWLFICSPQGLYVTDFSSGRGKWLEQGPRPSRPCERLFQATLTGTQ